MFQVIQVCPIQCSDSQCDKEEKNNKTFNSSEGIKVMLKLLFIDPTQGLSSRNGCYIGKITFPSYLLIELLILSGPFKLRALTVSLWPVTVSMVHVHFVVTSSSVTPALTLDGPMCIHPAPWYGQIETPPPRILADKWLYNGLCAWSQDILYLYNVIWSELAS